MFFELSADQQALRQKVVDFCARECPPDFESSLDQSGAYPSGLYRAMADSGLLKISFPPEYGGTEGSILDIVLIAEQLAKNSYTAVYMYLVNVVFSGSLILKSGSDAQKKELLPKLLEGGLQFSFALTIPDLHSSSTINYLKIWTYGEVV
jgi:alkylation response protein AidB-like acyl-CoA dehydrogenase